MTDESVLLESTVSEYRAALGRAGEERSSALETKWIVHELCESHDWTERGACAMVRLANEYGTFMLRNALALAVAMRKEDGDLSF